MAYKAVQAVAAPLTPTACFYSLLHIDLLAFPRKPYTLSPSVILSRFTCFLYTVHCSLECKSMGAGLFVFGH